MPLLLEKKLVEDYVIEKLKEVGWTYIEPEKLGRLSFEEPLLIKNLKKKILEINKDVDLEEDDLKNVLSQIQRVFPDQNGAKEILRYFKYGVPIKTVKERLTRQIQLFDFKNIENNEFLFSNQFRFVGRENIRLDLVLFVNGIPLVNIECKNPYSEKEDYFSAFSQIKKYEKKAPELYKYVQIGIGFAEIVKYFPIVPWQENVVQYIWKKQGAKDEEAIFEMLKPETILDILKNFIFVREFKGEMTKVISRYMQYRAVNKIYQRVMDNLAGKTEKNKGLIWHWLGAGKTLTMIFSAYKIFNELGKPTIFFIADRCDLERQFNDELSSLDLGPEFRNFEKIESIKQLQETISFDDFRGKRGVFLTLIHKFNLDEIFILEKILKEKSEISQRKDIICFLDEVHRTQYGILHGKMANILKNAFFFGFTGTPIALKERNTYKQFGYPVEEEPYLDRYFIDEAIKDGFVVPIVYQLKKEKDINLKAKDLEWLLDQMPLEDISEETDVNALKAEIRERINEITVFLENPKNIEIICQDISQHFKENFDGRFKGLIVAGSRRACVRFKKILDKYLPPEYSEVVMTYNQKDPIEIEEYKKEIVEKYKISDTAEIIKQIIEKFQKEEYPKLLIVTDMLITGFDEPKLGVIYLYKVLKSYRLLQTTARVNRPLPERGKIAGWILDYVGIFKEFERALKVYMKDEVKVIKEAIFDEKKAIKKLEELMKKMEEIFGELMGDFEKENLDLAFEIINRNEETGKKFLLLYNELRSWFEILPKTEEKLKYLKKYRWLSGLYYKYIKVKIKPGIEESKREKYFQKTLSIIHDLIEVSGIKDLIPAMAIDLDYIEKIRKSKLTETEKTIGILGALEYIIVTLGPKNPIYKSIADKVRELVKKWREREIDILSLKGEIDQILIYIQEKEKERKERKLQPVEFGIKLLLENKISDTKETIEKLAQEIFAKIRPNLYHEWNKNPAISHRISRIIRECLAKIRGKYQLSYEDFDRLHKEIFDYVFNNA